MKWFDEVFLSSLFHKIGVGNEKWLTQKQTSVCCQYMTKHSVRHDDKIYGNCTRIIYEYTWNGRKICMQYSKKNGCGLIEFCSNREEAESFHSERQAEKLKNLTNRIKKYYTEQPDRYERQIAKLKANIEYWEDDLQACLEDGKDTADTVRLLDEAKAKLKLWENV